MKAKSVTKFVRQPAWRLAAMALVGLGTLLFLPETLSATPKPSWVKGLTREPAGNKANLRSVRLSYVLSWNKTVNAGKLEFTAKYSPSSKQFIGVATGKSQGLARALWPYDCEVKSLVDGSTLKPIRFSLSEQERKRASQYLIQFEPNRQHFTTTTKEKGQAAKTSTTAFNFDQGRDLLSSMLYLRSLDLDTGDNVSMVVTPFNKPYLTNFTVAGRETHKLHGKAYKTIRLDTTVGKVNHDLSIKTYEKIKGASVWVIDDAYRIPIELRVKIPVGSISARLTGLEWLE